VRRPPLDQRYASFLEAWDQVSRESSGAPIIDFDVAGVEAGEPLVTELHALEVLGLLRDEHPPGSFQQRRLIGHIAYLRHKLGERPDFRAYVRDTQGIPADRLPEEQLDHRRTLAAEALGRVGIELGAKVEYELEAADTVIALDDLPTAFRAAADDMLPSLEAALGHALPLEFDTGFTDDDGWWSYWADTEAGRFRLRFNRRHRATLTAAEVRQFAAHEVLGHLGQMTAYAARIEAGELPPSFGITTVHTLEQFTFEGVAQTLPLWLERPDRIDELLLARIRLTHYCALVEHNAHLMINEGEPVERCGRYMLDRLPHYQPRRILLDLAERANDPLERSSRFVYPTAMDAMVTATERLDEHSRQATLRSLYSAPIAYGEFAAAVLAD
jgi:hypothetical protein